MQAVEDIERSFEAPEKRLKEDRNQQIFTLSTENTRKCPPSGSACALETKSTKVPLKNRECFSRQDTKMILKNQFDIVQCLFNSDWDTVC